MLRDAKETQLIIIDRDYERGMTSLKNVLPDLTKVSYNLAENFLINYRDSNGRLMMVAKINRGETDKLFKFIHEKQFFDSDSVLLPLSKSDPK